MTTQGAAPALIVLVTAPWCVPCRPAATVMRELARRHPEVQGVVISDPPEDLADALGVEVIPTWLRLELRAGGDGPAGEHDVAGGDSVDHLPQLWDRFCEAKATDPTGAPLRRLAGAPGGAVGATSAGATPSTDGPSWWCRTRSLRGAHPKHVVERAIFRGL
ncbi:thioredoxin family protein [Brachybacterium sp. EF45031]|uniref:thioredoxin family protein n=1 Tax=Brachybacterium sillae TaxID=2810536 RepID=UPI00217D4733|nr:thioredoxin family protein [Brachybacterium sillae]MCS6711855.1 thioredoxin family protein [Brachybacterium sillae]